jgi:hypothetical protein
MVTVFRALKALASLLRLPALAYQCRASLVNVYVNVYLATVAYFYATSKIPPHKIFFFRIFTVLAMHPWLGRGETRLWQAICCTGVEEIDA